MKGLMLLLWLFPALLLADIEEGRRIYFEGRLLDGRPVPAYLGSIPSPRPLACVNCHRESGLGTSESGKTIPPIAWSALDKEDAFGFDYGRRFRFLRPPHRPYTTELFYRVITTGVDSSGRPLKGAMPRYALTPEQSQSLVEYLKTLFVHHSPGVNDREMTLALVVDARLPQATIDQHLAFFNGLLKMKNAETRQEGLRKRFAPVQKIPKYESYRKWRFVVWTLSDNPRHWKDELSSAYDQQPVFALLAPLVRRDYPALADFCESRKVPCLLPPLAERSHGSYYSFLLRDWGKRLKQYLSARQSTPDHPLYRVDGLSGRLQPVDALEDLVPLRDEAAFARFVADYRRHCRQPASILLMPSPGLQPRFAGLDCPDGEARASLKLVLPEHSDFADFTRWYSLLEQSPVCIVSDYDRPQRFAKRSIRAQVMARRFGIQQPDLVLLARDLYAFGVTSDSVNKMNGAFSRKYLLEIIEHMLNSYPNYTDFAETSGAPYQREVVGALVEYCGRGQA